MALGSRVTLHCDQTGESASHLRSAMSPLTFLTFGVGVLCGEILIVGYLGYFHHSEVAPTMSYSEFVSILLTGIGVILAILALFIAMLAVSRLQGLHPALR